MKLFLFTRQNSIHFLQIWYSGKHIVKFEPDDQNTYTTTDTIITVTINPATPAVATAGSGSTDSGSANDTGTSSTASTGTTAVIQTETTAKVTVPVSEDENTVHVGASVTGKKVTIDNISFDTLNTVIGDQVKTGVVIIDFSTLDRELDTVEIPAGVVKQIADAVNNPDNDAESLEIIFTDGTSIEFDAKALGEESRQAEGMDITISIKHTSAGNANLRQLQVIGDRPAYDINVTSGGKHISDMGGKVAIHAPYELRSGERPEHLVVYYVDNHGRQERCETSYDSVRKRVNWKTDHLSVYMIDYDESVVWSVSGEDMASGSVDDADFEIKTGEDTSTTIPAEDSNPVTAEGDSMEKESEGTAASSDSSQGAQLMEFETKEDETSRWILLLTMAVAAAGATAVVILSKKKKEKE